MFLNGSIFPQDLFGRFRMRVKINDKIRKAHKLMIHRLEKSSRSLKSHENVLFLKRLMKNPRSLGAVVPSSRKLGEFICRHVDWDDQDYILEVGAGTGRFTQCLLESGVPPEKLIVVELDTELFHYLQRKFPQVLVLHGSAGDLEFLLPKGAIKKVRTIVSGIPMVNLSKDLQRSILDACFAVASSEATFLQFTYRPLSPIPAKEFQLEGYHLGTVFLNFPPATVWRFRMKKNNFI